MNLTYQYNYEGVDWAEVEALFRATSLGGRAGDKIRRSFENSSLVSFVFARHDGERHVAGMYRAITDWEYHAVMYDVAVYPELQGRGIGSAMMRELLARLPVWWVMLVSDEEAGQRFYSRLDFEMAENVMARLDWNRLYDAPAQSDPVSRERNVASPQG